MGQRWLKNSIEEKQTNKQTNKTLKRKEKKEMQKETNKIKNKNYNQFFNCSVRWQFPNIKTKTKGISPLQKEIYFTKFPAFLHKLRRISFQKLIILKVLIQQQSAGGGLWEKAVLENFRKFKKAHVPELLKLIKLQLY